MKNNSQDVSKPVARHFNQPGHSHNNMKIFGLSLHQGNTESRKCTEQRLIFKIGTLNQKIHTLPLRSVSSLIPFLTPFTHNPLIRSDEGLALETSAIVSFTAFHYPHQHAVDTPVCLPPRRRSQPSSLKSWHYTIKHQS